MRSIALCFLLLACAGGEPSDTDTGTDSDTDTDTDTDTDSDTDQAPTDGQVAVLPEAARTTDTLRAEIVEPSRGPGDITYDYIWFVDDAEQPDLTADTVPADRTERGQLWSVLVTPSNASGAGEGFGASVTIGNSPPSAPKVVATLEGDRLDGPLHCAITEPSVDPDADPVSYSVSWTLNGAAYDGVVAERDTPGDLVSAAALDYTQTWSCSVQPSDGLIEGPMVVSEPVVIELPPRLSRRAGLTFLLAETPASAGAHARLCEEYGLIATAREVDIEWNEALMEQVVSDFGFTSLGRTLFGAPALWCWEEDRPSGSPQTGECETHSFGPTYLNNGPYDFAAGERPVYTCVR